MDRFVAKKGSAGVEHVVVVRETRSGSVGSVDGTDSRVDLLRWRGDTDLLVERRGVAK